MTFTERLEALEAAVAECATHEELDQEIDGLDGRVCDLEAELGTVAKPAPEIKTGRLQPMFSMDIGDHEVRSMYWVAHEKPANPVPVAPTFIPVPGYHYLNRAQRDAIRETQLKLQETERSEAEVKKRNDVQAGVLNELLTVTGAGGINELAARFRLVKERESRAQADRLHAEGCRMGADAERDKLRELVTEAAAALGAMPYRLNDESGLHLVYEKLRKAVTEHAYAVRSEAWHKRTQAFRDAWTSRNPVKS